MANDDIGVQRSAGSTSASPTMAYQSEYTGSTGWGFGLIDDRYWLSPVEKADVTAVGKHGASLLYKSAMIVSDAMKAGDDNNLAWVKKLALGTIPAEFHEFIGKVLIASGSYMPRNFRADLLGDGTIAELQCPGSGWGYVLALEERLGVNAQHSQVIKTYGKWLGSKQAVWWLYNEALANSVAHLCAVCQKSGINLAVKTTDEFDPDDPNLGIVIKRPPLPMLVQSPKGRRLLERWMAGEVEMDPPPNIMFDSKYALPLLYHQETRGRFTDDERRLCRPTFLVESMDQMVDFGNGQVQIGDLYKMTKDRRHLVLKYAGADFFNRYGGHAVYALHKTEASAQKVSQWLTKAIADNARGEGWILQPFVESKRTLADMGVTSHDGGANPYYLLFRPGYHVEEDGNVKNVGTLLNLRITWKVHGSSDTIWGLAV